MDHERGKSGSPSWCFQENLKAAYPAHRGISMPSSGALPAHAAKSSFDKLSETAESLNIASHHLNEAIERLNGALKKLNLGIQVWVRTWAHEDDHVSSSSTLADCHRLFFLHTSEFQRPKPHAFRIETLRPRTWYHVDRE